jgi:hypothetical protein
VDGLGITGVHGVLQSRLWGPFGDVLASWRVSLIHLSFVLAISAFRQILSPYTEHIWWVTLCSSHYQQCHDFLYLPYNLAYKPPLCGPCETNALSWGGAYSKGIYYGRWSVRHTNFTATLRQEGAYMPDYTVFGLNLYYKHLEKIYLVMST